MENSSTTWDFSAALAALSAPTILHNETKSDPRSQPEPLVAATSASTLEQEDKTSVRTTTLGNFESLWDFFEKESHSFNLSPPRLLADVPPRSPDLGKSGKGVRANGSLLLDYPDHAVDLRDGLSEPASLCRTLGTKRKQNVQKEFTRRGLETPSEVKLSSTFDFYAEERAKIGEEKRRKIMQDMSEKPSTPAPKRRNDMEAHSKLVPSSIGVQKSKQGAKGSSSVLLQQDISESVKKIAGVISLLSQRFPGYSLPLKAYSLQPDHIVDHGGIHIFVDISNVGSSRERSRLLAKVLI